MTFILSGADCEITRLAGGKGSNLQKISQLPEINVPDFRVIETTAYFDFIERNRLGDQIRNKCQDADATDDEIIQMFLQADNDKFLNVSLKQISEFFAGKSLAVRSSSQIEDGSNISCAGIFSSFLNVRGPAELAAAVKKCWASCFSQRARQYLAANRIDLFSNGMAVVVMPMLSANVSGVAFSVNPADSNYNQLVIDSVYGIGEGLVSGFLESDHFVVSRSDLQVLRQNISKKKVMLCAPAAKSDLQECEVPAEKVSAASLNDEQIHELSRTVLRLEKALGAPQDIEWAWADNRLYILQTRPITGLVPDKNILIWDNANVTESYSGITSPLTFSTVRYFYYRSFKGTLAENGVPDAVMKKIDHFLQNMLGYFNGHIYYNLVNWYNMIFVLPGIRHYKGYWEQMIGVRETLPEFAQKQLLFEKSKLTWSDRWFKFKLGLRLVYYWFNFEKTVESFIDEVTQTCKKYTSLDLENQDMPDLARHYRDLESMLLEKWHVPNINDFYTIMFFGALKSFSEKYFGPDATIHNDLLTGEGNIISTEPAREAVAIAKFVQSHEPFKILFEHADPLHIYNTIKTEAKYLELNQKISDYISRFGFRCMNELKFEAADLVQKPENFIITLKNYLAMQNPDQVFANDGISKRRNAEKTVNSCLKGRQRIFYRFLLQQTRNSVRNRENLRFQRTRVFGVLRRIFIGMGRYLAKNRVLNEPADVYFLTNQELFSLIDGTSPGQNMKAIVAQRQSEFNSWKNAEPEDRFVTRGLVYTHNIFTRQKHNFNGNETQLHGISCSPGKVTGKVKVIAGPDADLRLNSEILVAKRTDPGWVVLYPSISGLIIEKGSLVSHSVIVAREMGIPTVVSVPGLTERLKTGDWVELDADNGIIKLLGQPGAEGQ